MSETTDTIEAPKLAITEYSPVLRGTLERDPRRRVRIVLTPAPAQEAAR